MIKSYLAEHEARTPQMEAELDEATLSTEKLCDAMTRELKAHPPTTGRPFSRPHRDVIHTCMDVLS